MPASSARAHKAKAVSGVSSDGLRMTVHPAASAGAIFLVITSRKNVRIEQIYRSLQKNLFAEHF